ncbi:MAG TPA: class I SAM-dependent methyltransferase [Fibrobacteria bacterium]|nr:class I SAM-dependent methyltransferase [Fibrobacteria bacterium]
MARKLISWALRASGLLGLSDSVKYRVQAARMRKRNQAFFREHPGLPLPPPYLVYESYALDYRNYYYDGLDTARFVLATLGRHKEMAGVSLLDWGCGPARVVRHLPGLLAGKGCSVSGSDYNPASIAWCKANVPDVAFALNGSEPPLAFPDASHDAVYGISVLTHLTPEQHRQWARELHRILRPGGIAFLSTHGGRFRFNLMPWEKRAFDKGELVARGNAKRGHRTYTSFQPAAFMEKLARESGLEVLEHREGGPGSQEFSQDVWILKKPAGPA